MESLPTRIKNYWLSRGVKIRTGASPEDLIAFERTHGITLPADVRAFLQAVNGFEEGEWDEEMVEWYPISKWEPMTDPPYIAETLQDAGSYYLFADYCIQAGLYAIRLGPGADERYTVIGWLGGDPPSWRIANSF